MKINSKFSIAVHILLCITQLSGEQKVTSKLIASSVNVNAVIIRKILGLLKKASLVKVISGSGGAFLTKSVEKITLLDVYKAVNTDCDSIFSFHNNPNPKCFIGKNIHNALDGCMDDAQKAMEESLDNVSLKDISLKIKK